jgi:hypothetical protein
MSRRDPARGALAYDLARYEPRMPRHEPMAHATRTWQAGHRSRQSWSFWSASRQAASCMKVASEAVPPPAR